MMQKLRERRTMQAILWGLVATFLATIFLAWGMDLRLSRQDPNQIAKIGEESVRYEEFSNFYSQLLENVSPETGEELSPEIRRRIQKQALDHVLERALLREAARRWNHHVGLKEVAENLRRVPLLQDETGRFSQERYLSFLQQIRMTPEQFEKAQQMEMQLSKLQDLLAHSSLISPEEWETAKTLAQRSFQLNLLVLNPRDFEKKYQPDPKTLEGYYETNRSRYDRPEKRKVRHILLSLPTEATAEEARDVEKTLNSYREKILKKEISFEEVAKQFSQDPGSKDKGGEVGWVERGQTVPEFEETAFSLKKGELSKPIRTTYGYHLIQVDDVEEGLKSTFQGVRSKVLSDYRREKADGEIQRLVQEIQLLLQEGRTLPQIAENYNLPLQKARNITYGKKINGFENSEEIITDLLFLQRGDWLGPRFSNDNRFFVQIENTQTIATVSIPQEELQKLWGTFKTRRWIRERISEWKEVFPVQIHYDRLPEATS